jgi:hypothetical protein
MGVLGTPRIATDLPPPLPSLPLLLLLRLPLAVLALASAL